jgi:hypothetical protein
VLKESWGDVKNAKHRSEEKDEEQDEEQTLESNATEQQLSWLQWYRLARWPCARLLSLEIA